MRIGARTGALGVLLAMSWMTGCSGDDGGARSPATPQAETTTAQPELNMMDVCPAVEDALPGRFADTARPPKLEVLRADLVELHDQSDLESQNALDLMIGAVDQALGAYEDPEALLPTLDASGYMLDGISAFATRCKAAGSSALQ